MKNVWLATSSKVSSPSTAPTSKRWVAVYVGQNQHQETQPYRLHATPPFLKQASWHVETVKETRFLARFVATEVDLVDGADDDG